MKTYLNKIVALIMMVGLVNCTGNFDELAVNPNKTEQVIPSLLFTGVSLNLASGGGKPFFYSQMVSKQIVWTEAMEDYQYNRFGRSSFYNYSILRNVDKMVEEAERTEEDVYIGMAHFFRAWFYYDLTMAFGDIPFEEAMKGETENIYSPVYDSQETVFAGILNELELANEALMNTTGVLTGDIFYNNDIQKWRKAVNTFTLRVLMTLSAKEGNTALGVKEHFNQIVSNPLKYPLIESLADNMMFIYTDKQGERYPFFNHSHQQYPHLDESFVNILKEQQDRRLFYYAQPTGEAVAAGIPANSYDAYAGGDGTLPIEDLQQLEIDKQMSRIHVRYYTDPENEPYIVIGLAEKEFLIAEAVWRGWIDDDAATRYNNGIKASMKFYETYGESYEGADISDAYIDAYIEYPRVQYDPANGLEQIITQKYIATFLQNNWLQYYENRRTGFPELKINPSTSLNTGSEDRIPVRWMYPQSESDANKENVEDAIKRQYGEDNVNAVMWLLK
ncbi:SusD/RagB family nutrient-binding outer membrane lipoprotein [Carboxylicivirga mesophila]|uniref:SusD/RagB family nutrient-binding outer membrane lipoprotein n=1 Tax=Carboxylicivirga mesophila TaxID=1166478 RepID=A0ABS5K4T6_9BACT|nr:SusD/RagB family nutrient-binding outer membrane lipoprotein [Carboxylicivirga mesophila]MBS2210024.1 SusD/RagB family nutrient-binding outer membrane lipoprotein [Carboxylicivirga mesophila]